MQFILFQRFSGVPATSQASSFADIVENSPIAQRRPNRNCRSPFNRAAPSEAPMAVRRDPTGPLQDALRPRPHNIHITSIGTFS